MDTNTLATSCFTYSQPVRLYQREYIHIMDTHSLQIYRMIILWIPWGLPGFGRVGIEAGYILRR